MSGGAIPLNGVAAVVTLPDALTFVADSARVDGAARSRLADDDGALTFRLGNTAAAFEHTSRLRRKSADVHAPATAKALAMFEVDGKRLRTPVVSSTVGASVPARAESSDVPANAPANVTVVEVTAKRTLTPRRPFEIPALEDAKIPAFDAAWLAHQIRGTRNRVAVARCESRACRQRGSS